MLDPTTETEVSPPSDETVQPSQESTETVESLKVQLAAEQKAKLEAEEDAKRWKNRVKDENPPKKKTETEEDYADWRIDNKDRISLVKEHYERELSELQESGMKLSNAAREKALKLAELTVGVKKADPSEALPSPSVDRSGSREPIMSEYDNAFKVKPETKKKYANLEKEWM